MFTQEYTTKEIEITKKYFYFFFYFRLFVIPMEFY